MTDDERTVAVRPTSMPVVGPEPRRHRIRFPGVAPDTPPDVIYDDQIGELLPLSMEPTNPDIVSAGLVFWPLRQRKDVGGLTIHHTAGRGADLAAIEAAAAYHTNPWDGGKTGKGLPSIQYQWCVAADGKVYQTAFWQWWIWHDHAGRKTPNLSVCMLGDLSKAPPTPEQLYSTTRLCAWVMEWFGLGIETVDGHHERAKVSGVNTTCPGWHVTGWRGRFFDSLAEAIEEESRTHEAGRAL